MKRIPFITKLIYCLLLVSCSVSTVVAQHNIGHTTITFQDPNRNNRNIQTEIYYPATTGGTNSPVANGRFPVMVFGHGFVMAWSAYQNWWDYFVPKGYIMVFPRTEGSIFSTNHQAFGWDLQFLVQAMQDEGADNSSILYGVVDTNTALLGHSMGGGAAFLAADSLCQANSPLLKGLIGLAPAESTTNGVSSIQSAKTITVPSFILSGSQDGVTPPVDHHIPMYDSLVSSCKTFLNIVGGAHCYFANPNFNCDFGEGTASAGISISRGEQHDITFDFVGLWLDYHLKGDCTAFTEFQDSLSSSTRIMHNQVCSLNPIPQASASANGLQLTASPAAADSYQWIDCTTNLPIANATNAIYTGTIGGSYAVVVTKGGCSDTSACVTIVGSGINTMSKNWSTQIYPNPVQHELIVVVEGLPSYRYQVHNVLGETYLSGVHNENTPLKLLIQEFPQGVYFLNIQYENESSLFKIIKE